jgi:hypothetical protein
MCPLKAYLFESCSAKGKWTQLNMKNNKHIHQKKTKKTKPNININFSHFHRKTKAQIGKSIKHLLVNKLFYKKDWFYRKRGFENVNTHNLIFVFNVAWFSTQKSCKI